MAHGAVLTLIRRTRTHNVLRFVVIAKRWDRRGHTRRIVNGNMRETGRGTQQDRSDHARPSPEGLQAHSTLEYLRVYGWVKLTNPLELDDQCSCVRACSSI
jgi:hypothetical protein